MYAVIWPDGRILACSTWRTTAEALEIAARFDRDRTDWSDVRVETVRMFREIDG